MTKFEELMELITHNKNKGKHKSARNHANNTQDSEQDIELEISGTESTTSKGPLVATASEEMDPDIIDTLYTKPRHVPNRGEGASSWDSD